MTMSRAPSLPPSLANKNRLGEQLRMSGDFTGAIQQFDEVLEAEPKNAWTLAHRGAAKLSMGYLKESKDDHATLSGAIEDLEAAVKLHDNRYPWALSRLGEAYRSLARDLFPVLMKAEKYDELLELTRKAEDAFTEVLEDHGQQNNTWALAHRGATRALTYTVLLHKEQRSLQTGPDYDILAEEDFKKAIELNPSYSWALASYGFVLTLKQRYAEARAIADRAAANDTSQRLHIARTMSQLFYYEGQWDNAASRGWEALRANHEDFVARYFLAASLLRKEPKNPVAVAFMETTRRQLLEVQGLVHYLLDSSSKHLGETPMQSWLGHPVPETVGFYALDPVWKDSRANNPPSKPPKKSRH